MTYPDSPARWAARLTGSDAPPTQPPDCTCEGCYAQPGEPGPYDWEGLGHLVALGLASVALVTVTLLAVLGIL